MRMGNLINKKMRGLSVLQKTGLILMLTMLLSVFAYQGWYQPSGLHAVDIVETFTTAGTTNWVAPAGVTSVKIECWGAGGGGGTRTIAGASGGGGGGAYARVDAFSVTPGNSYSYTVGGGGAANTAGGSSSFNTSTCVAAGGGG